MKLVVMALTLLFLGSIFMVGRQLFPLTHGETIRAYAAQYGVSPFLVYSVIHTESRFNENALSPAGAKGLMQITDDTGRYLAGKLDLEAFTPESLYDPERNIHMGVYYLSLLAQSFQRKETKLAAYNAGPTRVSGWLQEEAYGDGERLHTIPFEETKNYVKRVILRERIYRILYFLDG